MTAPLTEEEIGMALQAAGDIGIIALSTMKATIPRLVTDLRAARAALRHALEAHHCDYCLHGNHVGCCNSGGCEGCCGDCHTEDFRAALFMTLPPEAK
jgi:hypothetical protein